MESPGLACNIRSLTSEHHEANAHDIRRLDSFETIFKTYVVTDSESETEMSPYMPKTETIKVKSTKTRKRTLRSLLNCRRNKNIEKLSSFRIASGKNLASNHCCVCNDDEVDETVDGNYLTPTNSNSNLAYMSTQCVAYNEDQDCEQKTSTSDLQDNSLETQYYMNDQSSSYCCCEESSENLTDPEQSYYNEYTPEPQMGVNIGTQSFRSPDPCCCHLNDRNRFYESGGYDCNENNMGTGLTYPQQQQNQQQHQQHLSQQQQQLTDMAQQIAQQLAQQFCQNQMMGGQSMMNQPMMGQPMMSQPIMEGQSMLGQSMLGQSMDRPLQTGCDCADQQFNSMNTCDMSGIGGIGGIGSISGIGGNTRSNFCCMDQGKSNCIDVESFIKNYPRTEPCVRGLTVMKENNNNCMCNIFASRGSSYVSDALATESVYSTDYKPPAANMGSSLCSNMTQMGCAMSFPQPSSFSCNCECPLPTSFSRCNETACPLPSSFSAGNEMAFSPFMTNMPAGDCGGACPCPCPMPIAPQCACFDLNQNY